MCSSDLRTFINLVPPPAPEPVELPPVGGTQPGRGPAGGLPRPAPVEAAPAPESQPSPPDVGRPDTTLAASPAAVGRHLVAPPQAADGRLWVLPRPALPEVVADALYGEPDLRDSVAVGRSELITALSRVKSYVDTGAFLAVQAAGAAVLHDAAAHLGPYVAQFRERRDAMLPALRAQGLDRKSTRLNSSH